MTFDPLTSFYLFSLSLSHTHTHTHYSSWACGDTTMACCGSNEDADKKKLYRKTIMYELKRRKGFFGLTQKPSVISNWRNLSANMAKVELLVHVRSRMQEYFRKEFEGLDRIEECWIPLGYELNTMAYNTTEAEAAGFAKKLSNWIAASIRYEIEDKEMMDKFKKKLCPDAQDGQETGIENVIAKYNERWLPLGTEFGAARPPPLDPEDGRAVPAAGPCQSCGCTRSTLAEDSPRTSNNDHMWGFWCKNRFSDTLSSSRPVLKLTSTELTTKKSAKKNVSTEVEETWEEKWLARRARVGVGFLWDLFQLVDECNNVRQANPPTGTQESDVDALGTREDVDAIEKAFVVCFLDGDSDNDALGDLEQPLILNVLHLETALRSSISSGQATENKFLAFCTSIFLATLSWLINFVPPPPFMNDTAISDWYDSL